MKNLITENDMAKIEQKREFLLTAAQNLGVPLLVVMLFASCSQPPIKMNQIQTIERGIDHQEFRSLVKRKPGSSFIVQHKGLSYTVEVHPMQTGTRTSFAYTQNTTVQYSLPVSEDYAFVFHKGRLIYWGFISDYYKADDELMRELAPQISIMSGN
jgi:hypothetical protein